MLDAAEATATLDELRERLAADPGSRLTISWRLTRPKTGGTVESLCSHLTSRRSSARSMIFCRGTPAPGCSRCARRPPSWPEIVERGGRRFRIAWCPSELEVRERLDEAEGDDNDGVVVLTPLDAGDTRRRRRRALSARTTGADRPVVRTPRRLPGPRRRSRLRRAPMACRLASGAAPSRRLPTSGRRRPRSRKRVASGA